MQSQIPPKYKAKREKSMRKIEGEEVQKTFQGDAELTPKNKR
jgi:hypothetical protein